MTYTSVIFNKYHVHIIFQLSQALLRLKEQKSNMTLRNNRALRYLQLR